MVLRADYEAKDQEVRTVRMAAKDKFEMERKFNELSNNYEALRARFMKSEAEYSKAQEKAKRIEELEELNERLMGQVERVRIGK